MAAVQAEDLAEVLRQEDLVGTALEDLVEIPLILAAVQVEEEEGEDKAVTEVLEPGKLQLEV